MYTNIYISKNKTINLHKSFSERDVLIKNDLNCVHLLLFGALCHSG